MIPSLKSISLRNTPLELYEYVEINLLLAFGFQIEKN